MKSATENHELKCFETLLQIKVISCGMTKKAQQVVSNLRGGWSVKSYGSTRATKTFKTQAEAVVWARTKSKKGGLGLYVHGRDGTVRRYYI